MAAYDSFVRTLAYSLKTGQCIDKLFGKPISLSPGGTLVVEHSPVRLSIYDPAAARETPDLTFSFPVSGVAFTRDGKKLLLVTNDQVMYTVDPSVVR